MLGKRVLFLLTISWVSSSELSLEQKVKDGLEAYKANLDKQISAIDYLLDNYYKDWNYTEADATEYVSNPINTYMLIKRTGLEWPNVKKVLFNETAEKQAEELEKMILQLRGELEQDVEINGSDKDKP